MGTSTTTACFDQGAISRYTLFPSGPLTYWRTSSSSAAGAFSPTILPDSETYSR